MKARSTLQYVLLHTGWNREKKGLEEDTFTDLPQALWKSNYCDNIHGNQANRSKLEGQKQQRYCLFVASSTIGKHEQYLQVFDLTVRSDNKLLLFTVS